MVLCSKSWACIWGISASMPMQTSEAADICCTNSMESALNFTSVWLALISMGADNVLQIKTLISPL